MLCKQVVNKLVYIPFGVNTDRIPLTFNYRYRTYVSSKLTEITENISATSAEVACSTAVFTYQTAHRNDNVCPGFVGFKKTVETQVEIPDCRVF